jgi:hypothetical protein
MSCHPVILAQAGIDNYRPWYIPRHAGMSCVTRDITIWQSIRNAACEVRRGERQGRGTLPFQTLA